MAEEVFAPGIAAKVRESYRDKTVEELDEIREDLVAEKIRIEMSLQDPEKLDRTRNGLDFYGFQAWKHERIGAMKIVDFQLKVLRRIRAGRYSEEAAANNGWAGD